jgi:hypothetical protein
MPGYLSAAQHKFQHPTPKPPQDSPHIWNKPVYGSKIQYTPNADTSPPLKGPAIACIQKIIGTLLFYSIAVDPTLLIALDSIGSEQSTATGNTKANVHRLFDYAATHPNATIRYYASAMILHIHSDASYLPKPESRSRASGHFILSDMPTDPTKGPTKPRPNGAIHTVCHILRNVMASAAESKVGALFLNCQEAIPLRNTLIKLGHPQPPIPLQTDNTTTAGFTKDTMKQKRSKAMDMCFHWIKCCVRQKYFRVYWRPGSENLANYHTKHHSTTHH